MTSKVFTTLALATLALAAVGCAEGGAEPVTAASVQRPAPVEITAAKVPAAPAPPTKGAHAPPLDAVLAEAKAAGKPVLLYFGAIWCGPCAQVEKDVMPNADVQAALALYRFQKYDAEIGEGIPAAKKFNISAYPTIVVLSPGGDEIDRGVMSTRPEQATQYLKTRAAIAKVGLLRDSEIASVTDPQRLISAAQIEEMKPEPSAERVRRLYGAALSLAKKQKNVDAAADASFAILQLDARNKDKKVHVGVLLDFAKSHTDSPRSVDAIAGLAAISTEATPKLPEIKRVGARIEDAMESAHKGKELRRLGGALKKLGDEAGGTRAEAAATKEGSPAPSAGSQDAAMAGMFLDPLGARVSMSFGSQNRNVPAEIQAKSTFIMTGARQITEECRTLPHVDEALNVRVYAKDGAVTRAVLLDPEASPELKSCVERVAATLKNVPASMPERFELHVTFSAKAH